jgi:hypothetical protein
MSQLYPSTCPLCGTRLEESPLGGGLVRRVCPGEGCGYATPSWKPEPARKTRYGQPRRRRLPSGVRAEPVGAGAGTWRRDEHWKDADER